MTTDAAATHTDNHGADGDAALVASLEAIRSAADQPATPSTSPVAPAPEQPARADQRDTMALPEDQEARLVAQAQARQAERRAREPLEQVQRELADLKAALARAPGSAALVQAVQAKNPAAVAAAMRDMGLDVGAVQQLTAKAQFAPSPDDRIGAIVEAKLAPVLETLARVAPQVAAPTQPQVDAATATANAKALYVEYLSGAAGRWPNLDARAEAFGAEAVAEALYTYAQELCSKGVDTSPLTNEELSDMYEKRLASRAKPPGAPTIASGEPTSQPPGASTASGGPTKTTSAPRSLTNGHAADAVRSLPRTQREIDAELVKELESIKRAAG
jgi:Tfp pilus assembly protein PilP